YRSSHLQTPPIRSGNDVVGAATMPPVGAYVSAFSVMSERATASGSGSPEGSAPDDQSSHHAAVSSRSARASRGSGGGSCEGCHVSTNGTRSPGTTSNSATVVSPTPRVSTGVRKQSASGPAMADSESSRRNTQGTTRP